MPGCLARRGSRAMHHAETAMDPSRAHPSTPPLGPLTTASKAPRFPGGISLQGWLQGLPMPTVHLATQQRTLIRREHLKPEPDQPAHGPRTWWPASMIRRKLSHKPYLHHIKRAQGQGLSAVPAVGDTYRQDAEQELRCISRCPIHLPAC